MGPESGRGMNPEFESDPVLDPESESAPGLDPESQPEPEVELEESTSGPETVSECDAVLEDDGEIKVLEALESSLDLGEL